MSLFPAVNADVRFDWRVLELQCIEELRALPAIDLLGVHAERHAYLCAKLELYRLLVEIEACRDVPGAPAAQEAKVATIIETDPADEQEGWVFVANNPL